MVLIMQKATRFIILRNVEANGRKRIPLEEKPMAVYTLLDEPKFNDGYMLRHNDTVFIEDRFHDWDWNHGQFTYYTRVAESADVLIVYDRENLGNS